MSDVAVELQLDGSGELNALSIKEVVGRYHGSLLSFLRQRLRTAEDASDVAQEAYLRMMQYEGSREVQSPSSLLFRIAINVANDFGRAEQTQRVAERCRLDDVELESECATPEREVAAQQDLSTLIDVIEQLPPKRRQVFLLSRVQCLSYPEIARRCGISVKMVEKHISQALAACMSAAGARS